MELIHHDELGNTVLETLEKQAKNVLDPNDAVLPSQQKPLM